MRSGTSLFFVITIAIVTSGCFSKKATKTAEKIAISSHAPVIPVLKGISTNALIQLTIEIPAGSSTNFNEVQGTLDANAVDALEKLEVYYSDTVPVFSDKKIIGSTTSLSPNFRIPISLPMTTGIHYLWLSGTLKASADL